MRDDIRGYKVKNEHLISTIKYIKRQWPNKEIMKKKEQVLSWEDLSYMYVVTRGI